MLDMRVAFAFICPNAVSKTITHLHADVGGRSHVSTPEAFHVPGGERVKPPVGARRELEGRVAGDHYEDHNASRPSVGQPPLVRLVGQNLGRHVAAICAWEIICMMLETISDFDN